MGALELSLRIADRCDRCGPAARSYVVVIVGGRRLDFCGHHFTKHEREIRKVASRVLDERHTIPA